LEATKRCLDNVRLISASFEPDIVTRGDKIQIKYEIESAEEIPAGIWLGASMRDDADKLFNDTTEDKPVLLKRGKFIYDRVLTVPMRTTVGITKFGMNVWFGKAGDSKKSIYLKGKGPFNVRVN